MIAIRWIGSLTRAEKIVSFKISKSQFQNIHAFDQKLRRYILISFEALKSQQSANMIQKSSWSKAHNFQLEDFNQSAHRSPWPFTCAIHAHIIDANSFPFRSLSGVYKMDFRGIFIPIKTPQILKKKIPLWGYFRKKNSPFQPIL